MGKLFHRSNSPYWYADFLGPDGARKKKCTKLRNKSDAMKLLSRWEVAAAGLSEIDLELAIKDFIGSLKASGRSSQHVKRTEQLIRAVVETNEWAKLGQVSGAGVERYAAKLHSDTQAARTIGSMITAVRSFCRWCVLRKYMPTDPTIGIIKPSIKRDRRVDRRAMSPAEWKICREYLDQDVENVKNGLSGPARLLLYWLAIETGLRSSELRTLKSSACKLDGKHPHVLVKSGLTKDGELAKQYISDSLRDRLQTCDSILFPVISRHEMARVLRDDCDEARALLYKGSDSEFLASPNSQGEILDFHCLRYTCGAWRVQQGVDLASVQKLMRHSTIVLTIDHYGSLAPDSLADKRSVLDGLT